MLYEFLVLSHFNSFAYVYCIWLLLEQREILFCVKAYPLFIFDILGRQHITFKRSEIGVECFTNFNCTAIFFSATQWLHQVHQFLFLQKCEFFVQFRLRANFKGPMAMFNFFSDSNSNSLVFVRITKYSKKSSITPEYRWRSIWPILTFLKFCSLRIAVYISINLSVIQHSSVKQKFRKYPRSRKQFETLH